MLGCSSVKTLAWPQGLERIVLWLQVRLAYIVRVFWWWVAFLPSCWPHIFETRLAARTEERGHCQSRKLYTRRKFYQSCKLNGGFELSPQRICYV